MTVKGILTILPFESLVQVIVGAGLPSAVQLRVNISPLFRVWGVEMCVISGTSRQQKTKETRINKYEQMQAANKFNDPACQSPLAQ